ncbi:MAG: aminotransferase class V-fold PLP-dependent enzyme [Gemmatimonadetes bacterium]|nr:aminotransferase class V-fold PLP-dependent enzyme [Gemmatimonadota bacterium]MDA1104703.1 aminotransferase class V-fold PLP-dependent enzyme [Gemmatimonadota bacterium]
MTIRGAATEYDRLARICSREYPEPRRGVFLNAASWGILPRVAATEVAELTMRRNLMDGFQEAEAGAIQHRCRSVLAELLGTSVNEIALAPNTSFGVNLAAALLRSGPPGTIVLSEGEFPANVLPFKALTSVGFTVRIIPATEAGTPDEPALIEALGEDVVALAVSSVQFASGYLADMQRLGSACRDRGIYFFVDAIQSLGVAPFNPREVGADIVAGGGQKWLCAPWGSGFTWIRSELQDRFDPPLVSWLATARGADFDDMLHYSMEWRGNARKFELATLGLQDYLGLAGSVEVLLEIGIEEIQRHVRTLQAPLFDWIGTRPDVRCPTPVDPERRAGIVAFAPPDVSGVARALGEQGVVFSVREGLIRLAPHFYNTSDEISRVVDVLETSA